MRNKLYFIFVLSLFAYYHSYSQCTLSATINASGPLSFCKGDSVILNTTLTGNNGGGSTLDQSQYVYNGGTSARTLPGYSIMQSFTPSISGTLDKISMGFFNYINGSGTLNIYGGIGDTGTLLQSQTVSVFCSSGSCLIPFTVSANVTAGQLYTFDFTPGAGIPDPYGVQVAVPGPYAYGDMIIKDPSGSYFPGFDIVFETYVTPSGGDIKYQWQRNGTPIPSDTTSSITVKDSSGSYTVAVSEGGCADTSNSIHVTIHQPVFNNLSANICNGNEFIINGHHYDTTGIYHDTLTASTGCDSIITLHLSVKQRIYSTISASICPGSNYPFNNANLSEPGTYVDTLNSVDGCDSIIVLQLSITPSPTTTLYDTICMGNTYNFGGQNLLNGGLYYDTISTVNCDSIVILHLTTLPKPAPLIIQYGGDTLGTTTFTTYQWLLNNEPIDGAIGQIYIAQENGSYSVVTSNANGCIDTSVALQLLNVSNDPISASAAIQLYPNPTRGVLNIRTGDLSFKQLEMKIFDAYGSLVYTGEIKIGESLLVHLKEFTDGVYLINFNYDKMNIVKRVVLIR